MGYRSQSVLAQLRRRGWAPALWAHHPKEIKDALRLFGWRPQVQQCFKNSQRFILDCRQLIPELEDRLEYREGWVTVGIPMEHSWLAFDGVELDLTLDPDIKVTYLTHNTYTPLEILLNQVRTRQWSYVNPRALHELAPYRQMVERDCQA